MTVERMVPIYPLVGFGDLGMAKLFSEGLQVLTKQSPCVRWREHALMMFFAWACCGPTDSQAVDVIPLEALEKCEACAPTFQIYGFAQLDYIQDFNRVFPLANTTLRPTRIPTVDGLYGADGEAILSVQQSRFGVDGAFPVGGNSVNTKFEIDLFGVGDDEGQTTIRLRHAYGEYGNFLAGQTHSLFMDIQVFPNIIDYWGPNGMVFLRNPQIRWTPIRGKHTLAIAIENPTNDIDVGRFSRVIDALGLEIGTVSRAPDVTMRYRLSGDRGHIQAAGIIRQEGYETLSFTPPGGGAIIPLDNRPRETFTGYGINVSTNVNVREQDRIILSFVYGEGIASYMNDGGTDLAPTSFDMDAEVQLVPLRGLVGYYDLYWTDRWSTSIGYAMTEVDNLDGQSADSFQRGQYASANLLHTPNDRVLYGIEYLWGKRKDFGGQSGEDNRIQISLKYSW